MTIIPPRLIFHYAQGNVGAISFLNYMNNTAHASNYYPLVEKLQQFVWLRGKYLYILWNDLCNQDDVKVGKLCRYCPEHILQEACFKEDRSGLPLVEKYFNKPQTNICR